MKRPLKPEDMRVWGLVAATVHPLPGRATPKAAAGADTHSAPAPRGGGEAFRAPALKAPAGHPPPRTAHKATRDQTIEPNRRHRIVREREPIGARLDLHGLDQQRARAVLEGFLARAWDEGYRAVLIITGKGVKGDGVLKRQAPEWLAAPHLAAMVAGISEAGRRHGGEGALYVALKRKPRT